MAVGMMRSKCILESYSRSRIESLVSVNVAVEKKRN